MNILIINCNRERSPQTLIPIGACCIASAVEAAGYDTHFLDLTFSSRPLHDVRSAVKNLWPDVIGLSIRNLDNCDAVEPYSYLPEVRAIVEICRQHSQALLVLGGPAVSLAPAAMLRYIDGDYAIVGEGERAFIELLRAVELQTDPICIPGVLDAEDDGTGGQTIAPVEECLQSLPEVDFTDWLSLRRYRGADAAYPIQMKRGCKFQCSYCRYSYLEGHHWRLREPAWVAEEVARASRSGLRVIEFVDSVFGLPTGHAIECCEAIGRLPRHSALCALELNPTACVPELVQAMNEARFSSVAITAESGSDVMLESMRKGFSSHDLQQAAQALRGLQAQKMWIFMIGAPGECEESVRETAKFIASLPPDDFVYVTFGVRVLLGTELQRTLIASGELDAGDDLLWPTFYHSPLIDPARAREILADSGFPSSHFVSLHDSGHWLLPTAQRVMARMGAKPPYWRHIPLLNRVKEVLHV